MQKNNIDKQWNGVNKNNNDLNNINMVKKMKEIDVIIVEMTRPLSLFFT